MLPTIKTVSRSLSQLRSLIELKLKGTVETVQILETWLHDCLQWWSIFCWNHVHPLAWSRSCVALSLLVKLVLFFYFYTPNLPQHNQWTNYTTTMVLQYQEPPARQGGAKQGATQTLCIIPFHLILLLWRGWGRLRKHRRLFVCLFLNIASYECM